MSLKTYFNASTDAIRADAERAGVSGNSADIGTNREHILSDFLTKHIPARFRSELGGYIFGLDGRKSKQIDVIVTHDLGITFRANLKPHCAVESVAAAFSVKSRLDRTDLIEALDNLQSIPQIEPSVINLSPLKPALTEYARSAPALFVFAYSGLTAETTLRHYQDYIVANNDTLSPNRLPRAIIMNGEFIICYLGYKLKGPPVFGLVDPAVMAASKPESENRGHALFWMIHEMTKVLSWLDGMWLDHGPYYKEAYPQQTDEAQNHLAGAAG